MFRSLVWRALYFFARLMPHRPRMTVLLYHSISETPDFFAVTPQQFEKQVQYIARHFDAVPLSRAFAHAGGTTVGRDSVAITFDDGYEDFITNALPVLERYNIPATVFILTGKPSRSDLGNDHPRITLHDIQKLQHPLVTVGSHGATHRKLTKLSPQEMTQELGGSRSDLQESLGILPAYVAYPKGSFNTDTAQRAREVGYAGAVTVVERGVQVGEDLFSLPRVQIDSRTALSIFRAKLSRASDWYYALWRFLRYH